MRRVERIVSIELTAPGFAFAILEGPERLIDWGGREVHGDVSVFLDKFRRLLERYRPDALVLEEPAGSRRGERGREWLAWAEDLASKRGLGLHTIASEEFRWRVPLMRKNRHAVAAAIAGQFPQLRPALPDKRRPWQAEPARIAVFVAIARALAAFARSEAA